MIEIEEELALQPHHSRVGLTLSQHRQRLLAEVQYYLERTGIEEEIQSVVRRRLQQHLSDEHRDWMVVSNPPIPSDLKRWDVV